MTVVWYGWVGMIEMVTAFFVPIMGNWLWPIGFHGSKKMALFQRALTLITYAVILLALIMNTWSR